MHTILSYLTSGATIITPNKRLANEVIAYYLQSSQQSILPKPNCVPYSVFLQTLFKLYGYTYSNLPCPILLSTNQVRYLWQQVITNNNQDSTSPGLIEEISEAWRLCQRWEIDIEQTEFYQTPQTKQFQSWARQFNHALNTINAITDEQIVDFLINTSLTNLPTTLVWYCFDAFTPEQNKLQHYLQQTGTTHVFKDIDENKLNQCYQYPAADEDEETAQLIVWIKETQKHKTHLSIVVPDLQQRLAATKRLFTQHFSPQEFTISLGEPLSEFPLVAHALIWLKLTKKSWSNFEARLLLSSPYLVGSQSESNLRAQFLQDSNVLQENIIYPDFMISELNKYLPKLANALASFTSFPAQAAVQDWVNLFITRLKQLGFPGEYSLNSTMYQSYQRFQMLLEEFRTYHIIRSFLSIDEALTTLETLAKNTIFQPETAPSSIQIMGFLEANGCAFDAIWVTKMTDEHLPRKSRPSAFIPLCIQRSHNLPTVISDHELIIAQNMLQRIRNNNPLCIFSYAHLSADKPNLASPLIQSFDNYSPHLFTEKSLVNLESYDETYHIPVHEEEIIRGGTSLLANQAKCPFKAFAAHRLHAKKELIISDGLSIQERGQIIHKVMELIWRTLKNQHKLLTIAPNELETIILDVVEIALAPYKKHRTFSFSSAVFPVELARLKRLIDACLAWEKERPAFEVSALEELHTIQLAGLAINVRIDRLDQCRDGKKWIIDYKTAIPTSLPWRADRPNEPQLLLYALLDETIETLLFTGLKEGQLISKGLSATSHEINGIATIKKDEQWDKLRQSWRELLDLLAQEFQQGHCTPHPTTLSLCQQCDFKRLCRFDAYENLLCIT